MNNAKIRRRTLFVGNISFSQVLVGIGNFFFLIMKKGHFGVFEFFFEFFVLSVMFMNYTENSLFTVKNRKIDPHYGNLSLL